MLSACQGDRLTDITFIKEKASKDEDLRWPTTLSSGFSDVKRCYGDMLLSSLMMRLLYSTLARP